MFGSEGCLKADVVPGCMLSTNCLLVIGHYSRTETCCPESNCTCLETIMELASWQTALSLEYASPAECVFSREDELCQKKMADTQNVIFLASSQSMHECTSKNVVVIFTVDVCMKILKLQLANCNQLPFLHIEMI